jgi:hypothetical protein
MKTLPNLPLHWTAQLAGEKHTSQSRFPRFAAA